MHARFKSLSRAGEPFCPTLAPSPARASQSHCVAFGEIVTDTVDSAPWPVSLLVRPWNTLRRRAVTASHCYRKRSRRRSRPPLWVVTRTHVRASRLSRDFDPSAALSEGLGAPLTLAGRASHRSSCCPGSSSTLAPAVTATSCARRPRREQRPAAAGPPSPQQERWSLRRGAREARLRGRHRGIRVAEVRNEHERRRLRGYRGIRQVPAAAAAPCPQPPLQPGRARPGRPGAAASRGQRGASLRVKTRVRRS